MLAQQAALELHLLLLDQVLHAQAEAVVVSFQAAQAAQAVVAQAVIGQQTAATAQ
jgi:hypothetical protein